MMRMPMMGSVLQGGEGVVTPPDPTESVTFTLAPASWSTRAIAARQGVYGPTRSGQYLLVEGDGIPSRYFWWSQENAQGVQVGTDPGDYVTALSGVTGTEVPLGPGNISAADVATATRSAAAAHYGSVGGSGADVTIEDSIIAIGCSAGGMRSPSDGGQYGARRSIPQFATNPLAGSIGQFGVWAGGAVVVNALGIYLADATTDVAIAIYTGGTSGSLAGTTLVAEGVIAAGAAPGWQWISVPSELLTNGNFRLVAKSNGASIPGYIANSDITDSDWPDAGGGSTYQLEIYDSLNTSPAVAFPASLSGQGVTNAGVYAMMAFQWDAGDGVSGVFRTRIGVHIDDVTDLAQVSSLTAPDAGGADLFMGTPNPAMLGMELDAWGIAQGTQHSTQGRAFVALGGSIGDAEGSTVLWQAQTTGSGTNAWLEIAIPGNVLLASSGVLWWGVRNNAATFNFRFAFNADRVQATPDANPADWVDASEYEIFRSVNGDGTGGNVHETNPAVAVASPVNDDGGFIATNTNYPGSYIVVRIPADAVSA